MKNTMKLLGIIALLAIIGLYMAACSGGDSDPEKTIRITGIPADYLTATSYGVYVIGAGSKTVAMGSGQLSGNPITCDLYIVEYTGETSYIKTSNRWTGKGSYAVILMFYMGENNRSGIAQSVSITDAVTTIPASLFNLP